MAENGRGNGEFAEKSGVYFYNFPLCDVMVGKGSLSKNPSSN